MIDVEVMARPRMNPLLCSDCKREIPAGTHPYTVRIEIFPRVEESLECIAANLGEGAGVDHIEEMKKIIAQMEAMDEAQAKLQEERVYSRFVYAICPSCRDRLAGQMHPHRG